MILIKSQKITKNQLIKEKLLKPSKNKSNLLKDFTKQQVFNKTNKRTNENSSSVQATEQIENTVSYSTYETANNIKTTLVKKYQNKKRKESKHINTIKLDKSTRQINSSYSYQNKRPINQSKTFKRSSFAKNSTPYIQKNISSITEIAISLFNTVKTSVITTSNIISYSIGMILLIVVVLFIGVFASLSDNSVYSGSLVELSDEVIAYTETITNYAIKYDVEEYVPLIQAIMMHESKGLGNDPMDASTFEYNPNYPDLIENPELSIDVGIHFLSDCIQKAEVTSPSDTDKLYLAIQSYDYGLEYIDWALTHFSGYSKSNSQVYLDLKKEQTNNTFEGNANYVPNVLVYYRSNSKIVEIAKNEVGNIGGQKYWSWYGFNSRVEWCACFVSWCAEQSGDLNVSIPRFSGVDYGMQWFKENNKWQNSTYIPSPGDIIFFDWDYDHDPDHVGIVEKIENNTIYTIEGNSNDRCRIKTYNLSSNIILGYGII